MFNENLGRNSRFEKIFVKKLSKSCHQTNFFRFENFFSQTILTVLHKSCRVQSKIPEFLNFDLKTLAEFSTELSTGKGKIFPQFLQNQSVK